MYRANDLVSHPGHGACVVSDVCDLDMTGEQIRYYKLTPCLDGGASVYVPVGNANKIGLRPLMSKKQANDLMDSLADTNEEWLSGSQEKFKRYRTAFSDNTVDGLQGAFSIMGALIKRRSQKKLGDTDKTMLENIQKKVLSELFVVLDVSMSTLIEQTEALVLQQNI